jgi:hypothetical protein
MAPKARQKRGVLAHGKQITMLPFGFLILLAMRNPTKTVNFELYFDEGSA